jgi:acyl transferase domain-containing protein/acyl carrier protein
MDTTSNEHHSHTQRALPGTVNVPAHKLLGHHSTLASRIGTHVWENVLDQRSLSYLVDHRIQSAVVMPGTAYLEMALAAGAQIYGDGPKTLRNVHFHRALFLPEQGARLIQFILTPGTDSRSSFQIYSRSAAAQQQVHSWVLHASGELEREDENITTELRGEPEKIQSRCKEVVQGSDFYQRLQYWGFQYGSTFQCVQQLWRDEEESFAQVVAPTKVTSESNAYQFHPALFDACLQVGWSQLLRSSETSEANSGALMPVSIEYLRVRTRPETTLWSHAIRRSPVDDSGDVFEGDFTLFGEDGNVAVEIVGARAQRLDYEPQAEATRDLDQWLYELQWQPSDRGADSTNVSADAGDWIIFADREGIGEVLASNLESQGEKCVLIYQGEKQEQISERVFSIQPAQVVEMHHTLNSILGNADSVCRGIVYLWCMNSLPTPADSADAIELDQLNSCGSLLHLVQGLVDRRWREKPRLWLITKGAQSVAAADNSPAVAQATLWGLGRTISAEHADLWGGLVDLDPEATGVDTVAQLSAELTSADGEDQIAFREGVRHVARLVRNNSQLAKSSPQQWRTDGSYLITGGLGDLGLEVARWMVQQGARRLILLGRTELPPRSKWYDLEEDSQQAQQVAAIRELERLGASIHHQPVDISDEKQLAAFLKMYRAEGWPAIRGVVCAAGQFLDKSLIELETEDLMRVLRPKVAGSWLLHRALETEEIDFFIFFSSASSLLPSPRLGSYAAANAFQDALSYYRQVQGQKAISINWGPWSEVGMAARAETNSNRTGLRTIESIKPSDGLEILGRLMQRATAQVAVMPINWDVWQRFYQSFSRSPFLAELSPQDNSSQLESISQQQSGFTREAFFNVALEERLPALESFLTEQIARVFRFDPSQLPLDVSLNSLGLDSLMGIEIKNRIEGQLGITLPMVALLQGPTIAELATRVLEQLTTTPMTEGLTDNSKGDDETGEDRVQVDQKRAEQLLANFDELSDAQVDQLLNDLEAEGAVVR